MPANNFVDLILDFNGGLVQAGQGYDIPSGSFNGFTFSPFTAFAQNNGSPGNLNEQIFQILAGVREDFADFNVRLLWDDQGVDSPHFDNQDTVVMITGDSSTALGFNDSFFGIAANVDVPAFTGVSLQSQRDTAFAFQPPHVESSFEPFAYSQIRELIDTISHEAGHTFGLSHANQQDSEARQLVTTAEQNQNLDSRFSLESLNHSGPETGIEYSETERLNEAVGAAPILPGDTQSSQTLPNEPNTSFLGSVGDFIAEVGAVDFLGDRDAFRFVAQNTGQYTIRQQATEGSLLNPVVTLWDAEGDFLTVGSGDVSTITFDALEGTTYYAVAGSDVDRLGSGVVPIGATGTYTLEIDSSDDIPGETNDNFADSLTLTGEDVSTTGTNIGFTGEVGEPNHAGASGVLNSAWWNWTAPTSGNVTIDTFGSDYDTTLAVYTGSSLGSLTEIASNDDSGSLQSQVDFNTVAGTTYQIAIDGYSSSTGDIALNIDSLDDTPGETNDNFADSLTLSGEDVSTTGTNIGFTGEVGEPNHAGASGVLNSAWWNWTAPTSGNVTIDTFGSDYDTTLAVYTGSSLGSLTEIASNDDSGSLQSQVDFNTVAGTTYQIAIDGYSSSTGDIALNIDLETPETPTPGGPIFGTSDGDELNIFDSSALVFAGAGNDLVDASAGTGNNRLYGGNGDDILLAGVNDRLFGGDGDDMLFAGDSDNLLTGGAGTDQFWIATADLPSGANTITDFEMDVDLIGIGGLGVTSVDDLDITQSGNDALISAFDSELAVLTGIQANTLTNNSFVFA